MPSRRDNIHKYYGQPKGNRFALLEKAAAASTASGAYGFKGPASYYTVVVRTDINGYTEWTRTKTIDKRIELLDEFFSTVVPLAERLGGVFFRDEGDCIVTLFTAYFGLGATFASAEEFCLLATQRTYGADALTIKTAVACGEVAYFQKAHEAGTEDWSAEGQPFVRAHRLEDAINSEQHIVYFADDYASHFRTTNLATVSSSIVLWYKHSESVQVAGLGLQSGWADVIALRLTP